MQGERQVAAWAKRHPAAVLAHGGAGGAAAIVEEKHLAVSVARLTHGVDERRGQEATLSVKVVAARHVNNLHGWRHGARASELVELNNRPVEVLCKVVVGDGWCGGAQNQPRAGELAQLAGDGRSEVTRRGVLLV